MKDNTPQSRDFLGFQILEFDLPNALLDQVIKMFNVMKPARLTPQAANSIPNAQGVYQLFHCGKLVYVGKTDSEAGLARRLYRHAKTIQGRHRLSVGDMEFKAVQVLVFSAMDLETALIKHYKKCKTAPVWNGSGFGNADPGRKRDTTALKDDGFDANYPVNIDMPLKTQWTQNATAFDVIRFLGSEVPYTIRHEKTADALAELNLPTSIVRPELLTLRSGLVAA